MATELPTLSNGATLNGDSNGVNSDSVKQGLARMLKGGVIMDVVNAEQVCNPFPFHSTSLPMQRPC
jgi:pyridoxal 5'-phosphate synthase pdxS subunit